MSLFDNDYDFAEELQIPYKVDPTRNYRDEIDEALPAWFPDVYQTSELVAQGAALADQAPKTPREVIDRKRRKVFSVPHFRYERAVDPNGMIHPVMTSTCRPSPDHPNGDDGQGTVYRVKARKTRTGWLFLEPGETFAGKTGDDYLAWCFAVKDRRFKAYQDSQKANADEFMSQAARLVKEQSKLTGEMTTQMAEKLGQAIATALRDGKKPRADSGT